MVKPLSELTAPKPIKNIFQMIPFIQKANSDFIGWITGMVDEYGSIVKLEIFDELQLFVTDPDVIREVLVTKSSSFVKGADYRDTKRGLARFVGTGILTSEGDFWKRQRKLVQPAFHISQIKDYADTMARYSEDAINRWEDGARLDIADEMLHLTLRIVARTIFDTDVTDGAEAIAAAMEAANDVAGQNSLLPTWIPTPRELAARKATRDLDNLIYGIIEERHRDNRDRGDLLSMLMLAEDEDGQRMTDKQLRDEAVTLFLAGHETTANAMNWTFMLLAQNPEVEAKLHDELDAVLQGRTPTLADLSDLPYTEMVIKESMRLYPPVPGVGRQAIEDVEIGGYLVPKGTNIGVFWNYAQVNPTYWDDPLAFQPERFSKENEANIERYAYLPFGGGPRICVGNMFAMMEAQIILATIAQRYTLALEPGQVIKPLARITMYPENGLPMTVTQRTGVMQTPILA